ncbi:GGDEF domain-containing protein [Roseomonas sp. HJA6]|uniref:diguanylate cyclase n=1 Tax=Roseomonas alba TaxID=2846776 RepID=A0ABS7ACA5_9PROT|nr:GGDEF domain-containing protein [Neoroseomonas alba]MBW6399921.1 GGDEF domain-containing protein [Neoroseomonas alba]
MTQTETIFVTARICIVTLCLVTVLVVWWHARTDADRGERPRLLMGLTIGLLLSASLLTLNDIHAALSPGEQMATYDGAWLWLLYDAGVPLLVILALRLMRQRSAALTALERASVTDALTELANRRGFSTAAAAALQACQRRGETAAMVMFDLDRFKSINDGHGHAAGDAVLRGAAAALRRHVRASDIAGRLGGEEFALLCPGMTTEQAAALAERVRDEIRRSVPHPAGDGAVVTTSAGVAVVERPQAGFEGALVAADQALYAAKKAGRDRVAIAGSLEAADAATAAA